MTLISLVRRNNEPSIENVRVYTRTKSLDAFARMNSYEYDKEKTTLSKGDDVFDIVRHGKQNVIGWTEATAVPEEILHPKKEKKVKEKKEKPAKKEKASKKKEKADKTPAPEESDEN